MRSVIRAVQISNMSHTRLGTGAMHLVAVYGPQVVECLARASEGRLAADKGVHIDQGVEALPPHKPGNRAGDADTRHAGGPAAEGEHDVDISPPIDQYAEEGLCEGVGSELTVGSGYVGAPEVGPPRPCPMRCAPSSAALGSRYEWRMPRYSLLGIPALTLAPRGKDRSMMIRRFPGVDLGHVIMGLHWAQGVKGGTSKGPSNAPSRSSVSTYSATWWAYAGSSLWLVKVGVGARGAE